MTPTPEESRAMKNNILAHLKQCDENKISKTEWPYQEVAVAFHAGAHPGYGEKVHWNEFDPWAKKLGWKVYSKDNTPHSDIIFERLL